ncbi:MAG: PDZ domain-containing protein [Frankiales bacterium]|nr:PDZ domain-containing protein [Frankiales bacterium]
MPRDVVYPPGKTNEQVNQENAQSMVASQNSAITAAARQLGFTTFTVSVGEVSAGSPADGKLKAGDVLVSVDGTKLKDEAGLRAAIMAAGVGKPVRIAYTRGGTAGSAEVTPAASTDGKQRPVIGIMPAQKPVNLPFTVNITLQDVGGPSAGLMFALGILDKLGKDSLTGGRYIAGTGEISDDGTVGPIGGIPQKLIAARDKGAVAFLVPEANCAEASLRPPAGLELVKVTSLQDALVELAALRDGRTPTLCSA